MSNGLELEIYFAIAQEPYAYKEKIASFQMKNGQYVHITIDHDLNDKPIIELVSDPNMQSDSNEDDLLIAHAFNTIFLHLKNKIYDSRFASLTIKEVFDDIQGFNNKTYIVEDLTFDCKAGERYISNQNDMLGHFQVNFSVKSHNLNQYRIIKKMSLLIDDELRGFKIPKEFLYDWQASNYLMDQCFFSKRGKITKLRKLQSMMFLVMHTEAGEIHRLSRVKNYKKINKSRKPYSFYVYLQENANTNMENFGRKDLHGLFVKSGHNKQHLSARDTRIFLKSNLVKDDTYIAKKMLSDNKGKIDGFSINTDDPKEKKASNSQLRRNIIFETRGNKIGAITSFDGITEKIYTALRLCSLDKQVNYEEVLQYLMQKDDIDRATQLLYILYHSAGPDYASDLIDSLLEEDDVKSLYTQLSQQINSVIYNTDSELKQSVNFLRKINPSLSQVDIENQYYPTELKNIIDGSFSSKDLDNLSRNELYPLLTFSADIGKSEILYEILKKDIYSNIRYKNSITPAYLAARSQHFDTLKKILDYSAHKQAVINSAFIPCINEITNNYQSVQRVIETFVNLAIVYHNYDDKSTARIMIGLISFEESIQEKLNDNFDNLFDGDLRDFFCKIKYGNKKKPEGIFIIIWLLFNAYNICNGLWNTHGLNRKYFFELTHITSVAILAIALISLYKKSLNKERGSLFSNGVSFVFGLSIVTDAMFWLYVNPGLHFTTWSHCLDAADSLIMHGLITVLLLGYMIHQKQIPFLKNYKHFEGSTAAWKIGKTIVGITIPIALIAGIYMGWTYLGQKLLLHNQAIYQNVLDWNHSTLTYQTFAKAAGGFVALMIAYWSVIGLIHMTHNCGSKDNSNSSKRSEENSDQLDLSIDEKKEMSLSFSA